MYVCVHACMLFPLHIIFFSKETACCSCPVDIANHACDHRRSWFAECSWPPLFAEHDESYVHHHGAGVCAPRARVSSEGVGAIRLPQILQRFAAHSPSRSGRFVASFILHVLLRLATPLC